MPTDKASGPPYILEAPEEDESSENVPPGPSGTPFKISTPAPTSSNFGCKVKSQVTDLQSPIVKHLSTSNKYLSLGPPKLDSNSLQSVPLYSFGTTGLSTAVDWLYDETLPEITLLDDTRDLTMPLKDNDPVFPLSVPPTPLTAKCGISEPSNQRESKSWVCLKDFEITLADVTHDSEPSPAEKKSPKEITRDIQASSSELDEPDAGRLDVSQTEESLVSNVSSDKCVRESAMKTSLEETRDVTMDNSKSSSEPNGQTMDQIQTSAGDASASQPASLGSSRNQSDLSVPLCTSDTEFKAATLEEPDEPMEIPVAVKIDTQIPQSCCDTEMTSVVPQPSQSTAANDTITLPLASDLTASVVLNSTAVVSSPQNKTIDLPESPVAAPEMECDATEQMSSVTTETSPVETLSSPAVKDGEPCDEQNGSAGSLSLQKSSDDTHAGGAIDLKNNTFECKQSFKRNATITLSESSSSDSLQKTLEKPPSPKVCNLTTSIKESLSEKSVIVGAAEDQSAKKSENTEETFEVNPVAEVASEAGKGETKEESQSSLRAIDGLSDSLNQQSVNTGKGRVSWFNLEESLDLRMDCLATSTPITTGKLFSVITEREGGKNPGAQKQLYAEGPSKPAAPVPSGVPSNLVCDRRTFLKQPLLPPPKAGSQLLRYKAASALSGRLEPAPLGLPMTRQRAHATEAALRNPVQEAPKGLSGTSSSYNLRATATGSKPPMSGLLPPKPSGIPSGIQRAAPGLKLPSARGNALPSERPGGPAACNPVTRGLQTKRHLLTRVELLPSSSKRQKTDAAVPPSSAESSTCANDANKPKSVRQPTSSQRGAKTRRDDAAASSSGASSSAACDAGSRVRGLKAPVNTRRAAPAKVQGPGCAHCALLEKENKRLNEELLKYKRQEEDKQQDSKRSQS